MNCQNCGAPLHTVADRDYFVCDYCTAIVFPQPTIDDVVVLGEQSMIPCPLCRRTLVTATVADARILFCEHCRGILCEQPAFGAVVDRLRHDPATPQAIPRPLNRADLARSIACPHCGSDMDTHPYYGPGNVVIDTCGTCRLIWLDHGELHKIVSAPGHDRPRQLG